MKGLIDSTLREGEQTVGVRFPPRVKLQIAESLMRIGIEEIELGIAAPVNAAELMELFRGCRRLREKLGATTRFSVWCRCRKEDIETAALLGPDIVSLSLPSSDLHLHAKLRRDRRWARWALRRALRLVMNLGCRRISVGFEDASRADPGFLRELAVLAVRCGAERLRFADTVGVWTPDEVGVIVRKARREFKADIGVHAHNDFGMATANAVTALRSGADWVDVTTLGLGERAGNARLEEVAGYVVLHLKNKAAARYRTALLRDHCAHVAAAAGIRVARNHPIVGDGIFACETGLHLQGLQAAPETYEPYDPSLVGSSRTLLIGAKAGRRALLARLAARDLEIDGKRLERLVARLRSGEPSSSPLTDRELARMALAPP